MAVIPLRSPRELDKMRRCGAAVAAIMEKLIGHVREGVTTAELD